MESESRVALTTLVAYASPKGTVEQATFVVLRAPTSDAFAPAAKLRQMLTRAFTSVARENQLARARLVAAGGEIAEPRAEEQDVAGEKLSATDVISALSVSDADLADVLATVRVLMLEHGVALLDGEVKFTPTTFSRLSLSDFQTIAGEYLATFCLA